MKAPWAQYGVRNWLMRLGVLAAIVGAAIGIAFGLGIIGGDNSETIETAEGVIQIEPANVLAPNETEVAVPDGDRTRFEVRALQDDGVEIVRDVGLEEGELAPNFAASNFDGERFQLSDYRGKVVFLNFWASWCGPCRAEMPAMQDLLNEYGDEDLVVLAINNQESYNPAFGFIEELGVDYTQFGLDPTGEIVDAYRAFITMPTSYFIDAEGIVRAVHLGQITYEEMVERYEEARGPSAARLDIENADLLTRRQGAACEPRLWTGDNFPHG